MSPSTSSGPTIASTAPDPTDAAFLSRILCHRVRNVVSIRNMSGDGGNSGGSLLRVCVELDSDKEPRHQSLVWKQTRTVESMRVGKQMGLTREAFFYQHCLLPGNESTAGDARSNEDVGTFFKDSEQRREQILTLLPKIYYSQADADSGAKAILMEDLFDTTTAAVQSGYFFGPSSPLNWNKDLEKLTREIRTLSIAPITMKSIAQSAFRTVATLHALFWNDTTTLQQNSDWLRASQWILHRTDQESWERLQERCATAWCKIKQDMSTSSSVRWDPIVVSCLDAAIQKADWEDYQAELQQRPFTLVHGDFHPANTVTRVHHSKTTNSSELQTILFDFEMVGVGSGPQDLGQYMISHVPPKERVDMEEEVVRDYYDALCRENSSIQMWSWRDCWTEYVNGGLGRWLWLLPVLASWFPAPAIQYFHDQVAEFLRTHEISPETVPMPRV